MKGRKGFIAGESGNPNGRPSGSLNRTTEEIKQAVLKLLDNNLDTLQKDLDSMTRKDRATLIISLIKHVIPMALPDKLNLNLETVDVKVYIPENGRELEKDES